MIGSRQEKRFHLFSLLTLIFSLLVVLAGSLVKATGAGMGCPDWPKCYGYWVPPMDEEQVQWQPGKMFENGQIIIHDNKLLVAKEDFNPSDSFDESQWEQYKKHDYAIYKPEHTIIEYVNRLCGAVLGIMAIFMLYFAVRIRKTNSWILWGSIIAFVLILFEGWLGAKVVDSNLKPLKISVHLYFAFLVLIAVVFARSKAFAPIELKTSRSMWIYRLLILSMLTLLVQLYLGANVREMNDYSRLGNESRASWLEKADWVFLIHRSFTWLYGGIALTSCYLLYDAGIRTFAVKAIVALIFLNILTGVVMGYFSVPQFAQPVHVVLASVLLAYTCILLFGIKVSRQTERE
ncbi:MAG: COX15/CtaA family protein [Flavobacteriales bacterium]